MDIQELKMEKLRRLREEKFQFYVPNGATEEFIDKVGSMDYFITLFSAANGVGKTTVAINIIANLMFGVRNQWFKGLPLFEKFPYPKRIRIISEPNVVGLIIDEMEKWFPKGQYRAFKNNKKYLSKWETLDGSWKLDIMTYDQAPKEFESATLGLIWFDEPPPYAIYQASVSRLRMGGQIIITATPLAGSEWMYDEIVAKEGDKMGRRTYVTADIEDACIEHGIRGHLRHEDIEKIIAQYSEEEREARIHGRFQHLTGLVFKEFDPEVHVIAPFNIDFKNYAVYQYFDPHPRTADAILWVAVDRNGKYFVVDELFINVNGDKELVQRIKAKDSLYRVEGRFIDPSALITDQHTQSSLRSRLADMGLWYEPATKLRTLADRAIHTALAFQRRGGTIIQEPNLLIFETCHNLILELQKYRWDEWTGKSADRHGRKEKPLDKNDHLIENLGRCMLQQPPFVEMAEELQEGGETLEDDPY